MRPILVLAVSSFALASFLAGLWIGSSSAAPSPVSAVPERAADPAPRAEVDPEFLRSMERLAASMDALQRSLAAPPQSSERREALPAGGIAAAPAPDLAALVERLEQASTRIAQSVAALPAQPDALASSRDPATTPRTLACLDLLRELDQLASVSPAPGDEAAEARWNQAWGAVVQRAEDSHRGWTLAQVLERYGAPDALRGDSDGPSYVYTTTTSDGREETVVFQSRHGVIYDVDVHLGKH